MPRCYFLSVALMTTVLCAGVDSLTITRTVKVPEGTFGHLDQLREEARREREEGHPYPLLTVGDREFEVQPGAKFPFRHLLKCSDVDLTIAGSNDTKRPTVRAEVRQAALWALGWSRAYSATSKLLDYLGEVDLATGEIVEGLVLGEHVARVDLCADFQGWDLVGTDREAERFLCRARPSRSKREDGSEVKSEPVVRLHGRPGATFTGYEWSRGGPLMVRLYRKDVEIARSGKDWMRAVWERHGSYDPELPVWRLEVQIRREALHQLGADGEFSKLKLDALWRYAFGAERIGKKWTGWLSYRKPVGDSNRSRWPVDDRWRALREARFIDDATPAVRDRRRKADLKRAVAQARGQLATIAASLDIGGEQLLEQTIDAYRHLVAEKEKHEELEARFTARVARRRSYLRPVEVAS